MSSHRHFHMMNDPLLPIHILISGAKNINTHTTIPTLCLASIFCRLWWSWRDERKKCVQSMMAEILLAKYMVIRHVIFGLCMLLCYLNNIFNHYECFYNYKLMVIAHFIDVFPASIFMWMVKSDHSSMSLCFMHFSCKFLDSLTTIMEYFEHSVLK